MKLGRNIGSVTIPKHPKTLGGVLSWIKKANRTMEELRNRKVSFPNQGRIGGTDTKPPFWVKLNNVGTESSPSYEVEIAWGYVIEIVPGEGDPSQYHEPDNIWEEDPSNPDEVIRGVSRKFAVNVGQAVYIDVKVLADGTVGADDTPPDVDGGDPTANPSVLIYIGAADESSLHYQPKVDTETSDGTLGNILYKLAEIKAAVSPATLATVEKFLTGSHISYFQELPEVKSALAAGEGIGVIPKIWDNAEKSYKFRAIKEKAAVDAIVDPPSVAQAVQIHVVQEANAIVIKGNSKARTIKYTVGDVAPESASEVATFDDGLETSGIPAGNQVIIPIPTVEAWDGDAEPLDAQIQVSNAGVNGPVYEVRGNAVFGDLEYSIGGGTAEPFAKVKDGLISEITGAIPIPAATSGTAIYHPWKVTDAGNDTVQSWDVARDFVYAEGLQILVAQTNVVGDAGTIFLEITRDSVSRAATDANLIFVPANAGPPESDDAYQYRRIAFVFSGADRPIIQYQFEEIRIIEDLIVRNGEFELCGLEMSHTNTYAPPI